MVLDAVIVLAVTIPDEPLPLPELPPVAEGAPDVSADAVPEPPPDVAPEPPCVEPALDTSPDATPELPPTEAALDVSADAVVELGTPEPPPLDPAPDSVDEASEEVAAALLDDAGPPLLGLPEDAIWLVLEALAPVLDELPVSTIPPSPVPLGPPEVVASGSDVPAPPHPLQPDIALTTARTLTDQNARRMGPSAGRCTTVAQRMMGGKHGIGLWSYHYAQKGPASGVWQLPPHILEPPVFGLGLLGAVTEADTLSREDPTDPNGYGISGRANHVEDPLAGGTRLGRFGWKASQAGLEQQNAGAFLGGMGITSPLHPLEDCPAGQDACAVASHGRDNGGRPIRRV